MLITSWRHIFFISHILIGRVGLTLTQPEFLHYICSQNGNYTSNSRYKANLDSLLSSIDSNSDITYGFYKFSNGENPDTVNAIALCRGDVELDLCRSCVNDSTTKLRQVCPNQKEAIGWYDYCMLRYSNLNIFHIVETTIRIYVWQTTNVSHVDQFNESLRTLLDSLKGQAASGGSTRKFATGNATAPDFQTLYGLVQCTPDLSELQCINCLDLAIGEIPKVFNGKPGGKVITFSCNLRYELYRFYNDTIIDAPPPPLPPPPPPPPPPPLLPLPGKGKISAQTIIAIVASIGGVSVLLLSVGCCFLVRRARKPYYAIEEESVGNEITTTVQSLQFDLGTIQAATNNFSVDNKIGQGGFGLVYKGNLRNGQEIAVKRLSKSSGQGATEFKNEVVVVAKLQHRNLVRLLGFCLVEEEKILIYEYVCNNSLDYFLSDPEKQGQLDWSKRYNIIVGIARGMLYLHEDSRLRIIHRDLKASNILLDGDMNPKISDFGMAKIFGVDQSQGNTSKIAGTFGYMSPEYVMHGKFSVKSDVFSFGVLILEIISGKKNSNFCQSGSTDNLLSYAWKQWRNGKPLELMDSTLKASYSRNEVIQCIHIGLLCVQKDMEARPSMASVSLMLSSHSVSLPLPRKPAFFLDSKIEYLSTPNGSKPDQPTRKSIEWSLNEASITELHPR